MQKGDANDPKGLIREAYNIEGITAAECRSIFVDWALSVQVPTQEALPILLERHGAGGHPMTAVLREGMETTATPRRRGGWKARKRDG